MWRYTPSLSSVPAITCYRVTFIFTIIFSGQNVKYMNVKRLNFERLMLSYQLQRPVSNDKQQNGLDIQKEVVVAYFSVGLIPRTAIID